MVESEAAIEEAKQKKASEQHRHAKQQKVPEEAPKVVPETTDYAAGLNGPAEQVRVSFFKMTCRSLVKGIRICLAPAM